MALTKENKDQIMSYFRTLYFDSGSPAVQIAMLTTRITDLTEHLTEHKHDFSTRRGLIKMVGRRRKLLRYMHKAEPARYNSLIERLGLRREDLKISGS